MTEQNIDLDEIRKFEDIARKWWDPDSEFKPLHEINPLRLGYITDRVDLTGKRVLDVGCGGGLLTEAMASAGATVTGRVPCLWQNCIGTSPVCGQNMNSLQ